MIKIRLAIFSCLQGTIPIAAALLVLPLLLCSGAATAEPPAPAEPATESQDVTELKIYRQRVSVNAGVICRVYERRPIFCTAELQQPITEALHPVLILKYSGLKIGDKAYETETTPGAGIKFRADKVNYTGQQKIDVEVIYVK